MDGDPHANRFADSGALEDGNGHTDGDIDGNPIADHRATDTDAGTNEPATTAGSAVTDPDKSSAPDAGAHIDTDKSSAADVGAHIDTDQSPVADADIASRQEMSIF